MTRKERSISLLRNKIQKDVERLWELVSPTSEEQDEAWESDSELYQADYDLLETLQESFYVLNLRETRQQRAEGAA